MTARKAPGIKLAANEATSQRARAYERFTEQILSGGIRAGQFVTQRELTELLDTPLGSVREMIPRLEAGGLVKTVPQRGLQIAPVDLKLIRNAFQIRGMIERESVSGFVRTASDAVLRAIEVSHEDILQRSRSGRVTKRLLLDAQMVDWGFHQTMVDALGNEIISEVYRVNSLRIRLISLEHSMLLEQAMQEHLRLISALRQRDADRARQLLDAHIESARNRVLEASLGQSPSAWPSIGSKTPNPQPITRRTA